MSDVAKRILGDKVIPLRADLVSVSARHSGVVGKSQGVKYVLGIDPALETEDDKVVVLSCGVSLGFEEGGPFQVDLKYRARYRKATEIDGKELVKEFDAVSYPILAEASMMISGISTAMGLIPLVISPEEMLQLANKTWTGKEA